MNFHAQPDREDRPPHAGVEPARTMPWIDDTLLDHHIEEVLGALSDAARLRLDVRGDIQA